nr:6-phosphogluconolactonase [Ornithinimicrobium sp. F0845]
MGRVLTLLIVTDEDQADSALEVANDATRQHPARILAVVRANRRGTSRLDAQIRVGGDAGASEVVVLRLFGEMADHGASVVTPLLLPDSPIVAWWPGEPPSDVAESALGSIARRRITDAGACARPTIQLKRRATHYAPGDTDLAWTRVTRWRGLLAAALDEPPFGQVRSALVVAEPDEPSADLIAGWLAHALDVPVQRVTSDPGSGIVSVRMEREDGPIDLVHADEGLSTLAQPGRPVREVALRVPDAAECLADELRRLDADEIYAAALTDGLPRVTRRTGRQRRTAREEAPTAPAPVDHSGSQAMSSAALDDLTPREGAPPADRLHERVSDELEQMETGTVRLSDDSEALAADVAAAVAVAIEEAVTARGVAHLVLTGGSMGARTVAALAALDLPAETWDKVHIWWGDERFVPDGHADRNDQQARDAGLDRIPVPASQVHSTPAGSDADELPAAADRWAVDLAAHAAEGEHSPRFDVVLLGLGPDTHVASLFPGRDELHVTDRVAVPVTGSPKPPPLRLTLTVPALNAAERVWFVVSGADKADAVAAARAAHDDPQVPASWVRGTRETTWWLDEAAAAT